MKAGRGIEVLNLYDWLPGHGETSVRVKSDGGDLVLSVIYDDDPDLSMREIKFSGVCSYYQQWFPGPWSLDSDFLPVDALSGAIWAYPDSEIAAAWNQHLRHGKPMRHFSAAFSEANLVFVVIADDVTLGEPTRLESIDAQ